MSLEQLPPEVLERVLLCPQLRYTDLVNCALAAPCFSALCRGGGIWRHKLGRQYPSVMLHLSARERSLGHPRRVYQLLCSLYQCLCHNITSLSSVFVWSLYHDYEWPDVPHRALQLYYRTMFDGDLAHGCGRYYVMDECYNIIHDCDRHRNLTLKYYAQKIYTFINIQLNFDQMWDPISEAAGIKKKLGTGSSGSNESSQKEIVTRKLPAGVVPTTQFDYLQALLKLASSIPLVDRVNKTSLNENLSQLYKAVHDKIQQSQPTILCKNLRTKNFEICTRYDQQTVMYSEDEIEFIIDKCHQVVIHEFGFTTTDSSVSKGYKFCVDKVLQCRAGDQKLLITLQAHLAQKYGVYCELQQTDDGDWCIVYRRTNRRTVYRCTECLLQRVNYARHRSTCFAKQHRNRCGKPSSTCHQVPHVSGTSCSVAPVDTSCSVAPVTEALFHRSILESLVNKLSDNLKDEWALAGGPIVYDLLAEETYNTSMRNIFSAWRYVEHWKIAQLRHYTLLLCRVSDDSALQGKLLHLNILLRVESNQTLELLTDFRRELLLPPSGIRDLQRMVASVDIRARARLQDLQYQLQMSAGSSLHRPRTFFASVNPSKSRGGQSWPGADMVQKRRIHRNTWMLHFAVGQIVSIRRHSHNAEHSHNPKQKTSQDDRVTQEQEHRGEHHQDTSMLRGKHQPTQFKKQFFTKGSTVGDPQSGTSCSSGSDDKDQQRNKNVIGSDDDSDCSEGNNVQRRCDEECDNEESAMVVAGKLKEQSSAAEQLKEQSSTDSTDDGSDVMSTKTNGRKRKRCQCRGSFRENKQDERCSCKLCAQFSTDSNQSTSENVSGRVGELCDSCEAHTSSQEGEACGTRCHYLAVASSSVSAASSSTIAGTSSAIAGTSSAIAGTSSTIAGTSSTIAESPSPHADTCPPIAGNYPICPTTIRPWQCQGVIYDWDSICVESEETLHIMGEDELLKHGTDQPFYRVLLNDGSSSYVAQENISHCLAPKPVNNPLLGRYFHAFVRPHYVPNTQKAYEYPEDATIREQDSYALGLL